MSGDNLLGAQPLKFYSEEMTESKLIVLSHFEKKFVHISNSVIYLDQKLNNFRVPEAV